MKNPMVGLVLWLLATSTVHAVDIVVDNDSTAPAFNAPPYEETGTWITSSSTGYDGGIYRFAEPPNPPEATATWSTTIPEAGFYEVSTIFLASNNRATDAPFTIAHAGGSTTVRVSMAGGGITEVSLGDYYFEAGSTASVTLTNDVSGSSIVVISDAVRFRTSTDDPPEISNLRHDPLFPQQDEPVFITALVEDDLGIDTVEVFYLASPSGSEDSVFAADDGAHGDGSAGDGVFGAQLPGFPDGEYVNYWVEVVDSGGNEVSTAVAEYIVGEEVPREYRAVWIDSWNSGILSASQIDNLVATCRAANINTIVPEVRKVGDAYYESNIEPRATNIIGADFDPLAYMIEKCHDTSGGKKYIEVHAWFVMHRISRGETLAPEHILSVHPEVIMQDYDGNTTAGGNSYVDPGHPTTVEHNIAVIIDCMANYDIDGVNLDYIRYPEYSGSWGYNARSIERFNAFTGKTGRPATNDSDWADWRRECVTLEVKRLYVEMMKLRPEVILTADTVNWGYDYDDWTSSSAYAQVYQNWKEWLEEGILDYNMLMNYSTSYSRYVGWTDLSLASDDIRGSIIGCGAYLQASAQDAIDQMLYARQQGADGVCIYDWGSEPQGSQFYTELKEDLFSEWADPPRATWKTAPTRSVLEGIITAGSDPIDHATIEVLGEPSTATHSDGAGWYGILELVPGNHQVRILAPGYGTKTVGVFIPEPGLVVTRDVDMTLDEPVPNTWTIN